jgi:hypothetical protein
MGWGSNLMSTIWLQNDASLCNLFGGAEARIAARSEPVLLKEHRSLFLDVNNTVAILPRPVPSIAQTLERDDFRLVHNLSF